MPSGSYETYQFTPNDSSVYYVYTSPYGGSGVSNDTYLEVYTNANLTGTPIASNDDYGGGRFSKVSVSMTEGSTYYIKVKHYNNGQVHAELNITKNIPVQPLTVDGYHDIITASGEFALYSFTPAESGTYTFNSGNYNGGVASYDTYLKLYDSENMSNRIGRGNTKVIANLSAGQTYYLQFSGFLMKYSKGRVSVNRAQTLEFKKRTDSSFIYVNNPEYITRYDIIDDNCHVDNVVQNPYLKLFEQQNVTGVNTYYQPHTSWWDAQGDVWSGYYPSQNFYLDIDFYNPTGNSVTVDITNIAYTGEDVKDTYGDLQKYYNGNGSKYCEDNNTSITLKAGEHKLLFTDILKDSYCIKDLNPTASEWDRAKALAILFDFEVKSGNVTVSSIAAYDTNNLRMQNGSCNILANGTRISSGIIQNGADSTRPNEADVYQKYKGIAKNEGAWIDSSLDFAIDNATKSGTLLAINMKDSDYTLVKPNQGEWMTHMSPSYDNWASFMNMPNAIHKFTYPYDGSRQWKFDYKHYDASVLNPNTSSSSSANSPLPQEWITEIQQAAASGTPLNAFPESDHRLGIGEWGATYHYTVAITNTGSKDQTAALEVRNFNNMVYGWKLPNEVVYKTSYIPNSLNTEESWTAPKSFTILGNSTVTFEIVTMLAAGHTGTTNRVIIY